MSDIRYRDASEFEEHGDIETHLNKEVDRAMSDMSYVDPDTPYEEMDQEEVASQIQRIAGEIQQVVSLIVPKPIMKPGEEPEESPQDPACSRAAMNLLQTQADALRRLVAQLLRE